MGFAECASASFPSCSRPHVLQLANTLAAFGSRSPACGRAVYQLLSYGSNLSGFLLVSNIFNLINFVQVVVLLWVCQWMVAFMWSRGVDPDNAAIPYLTALGDLLGTMFLFIVFLLLDSVKSHEIVVNG